MTDDKILFHAEDVAFELENTEGVVRWIETVVAAEKKEVGEVSYIFCDDNYLHQLNVEYLNHDTLTDIITFPYADNPIEGDIFISLDRVRDNAADFKVTFDNELHRVIIHGILHLCGYGDKTDIEAAAMRQKENDCLALFEKSNFS